MAVTARYTHQIVVSVSKGMKDAVTAVEEAAEVSQSEVIRRAIDCGIHEAAESLGVKLGKVKQ